ncbi:MAG: hypothetical protein WBV41_08710, partial [Terriglobales bacterium]
MSTKARRRIRVSAEQKSVAPARCARSPLNAAHPKQSETQERIVILSEAKDLLFAGARNSK